MRLSCTKVPKHDPSGPLFNWRGAIVTLALTVGLVVGALPAAASCMPMASTPGFAGLSRVALAHDDGTKAPERLLTRVQQAGAAAVPAGTVELAFLGHSSFLIRTPESASAVTDYNGYITADFPPDIVTMNRAHRTHYTDDIEPGVRHVLRGWSTDGEPPQHDILFRDLRVRNVPTNIRDGRGGTRFYGNSIFIFETVGLCIVHLGHLHHGLEPEDLREIGLVDVLLVPIDDGYTMRQARMAEVIDTLRPAVVVPMHFAGTSLLKRFAALMQGRGYGVRVHGSATLLLSRRTLPSRQMVVLPTGRY